MGIETRKGRLYRYARRRVGGRVRAEYLGAVTADEADLIRRRAALRAGERELARWDAEAAAGQAGAVLLAAADFDRLADRVFRAVMHVAGYRLHKRSQWRHQRGEDRMKGKHALGELFRGPAETKPALVTPVAEDPQMQHLLDRAARGDRTVLPAVRELLKDQRYVDQIGSVAGMALATLTAQAAGGNLAVAEAVTAKYRQTLDRLLADGGPAPTWAERMAATRAAHNWLAVHVLECLAAQYPPGGATAAALDRRLSQADKRLNASLKALAVLRRLRGPAVQVNVANGPMLVDNRAGG